MSAAAVQILQSPQGAAALLDPQRLEMLSLLREPGSASSLARQMGMPRQKLNYHLHVLEREGLVEFVEERQRGNCTERVVRSTARTYAVGPDAMGPLNPAGDAALDQQDRFSEAYLVQASLRTVRDVAALRAKADQAGLRLATLTLETEIRFASAARREEFTRDLTGAIARLAAEYHDEAAPRGRRFRLMVGAHAALPPGEPKSECSNVRRPPVRLKG